MRRMIPAGAAAVVAAGLALAACSSPGTVTGSAVTTTTAATASGSSGTTTVPSSPTTTAPPKGVYALGTTVKVPITIDGIDSATASGFYPNVSTDQSDIDQPPAGDTFDGVDVSECAGPKGSDTGGDETDFSLLLSNGSTAQQATLVGNPTVAPLSSESEFGTNGNSLAPNQCTRGWIVFEVPPSTSPTYVQFSGTTASFSQGNSNAKWTVPS